MTAETTHHADAIQIDPGKARLVAAEVINSGMYTTPEEVQSIAGLLDNPSALLNWYPDAVGRIRLVLNEHTVEWLTTNYFAS